MARIGKKIIGLLMTSLIVFALYGISLRVHAGILYTGSVTLLDEASTTSNFFTQVEDKTQIVIEDKRSGLLTSGYQLVCENDSISVYFKTKTFGLAVYDKASGYTWFSTYENVEDLKFTAQLQAKIESGISFEYYLVNAKGEIGSAEIFYSQKDKKTTAGATEITKVDNGCDFNVKFNSYGISFKVELRIDGTKLNIKVPYESIEEVTVGELNPKDYKLRSITLFPYFGSENYEINGYSFIPDGSGALIRYTDNVSSTAYIKKLYGNDYSFTDYSSVEHIKENGDLALPIYGVNHGYNQASFLCEATGGYGSMELISYPYMYSNIPINTTFFKYYSRDTFDVKMTSNNMTLLNEEVYPSDFALSYSFLSGNDANYIGMANCYRESLGLKEANSSLNNIPLRLELLGIDYKPGLFGKNYVTMTSYQEALEIINDLESSNVNNFNITYLGWNRGGYFTRSATNAKTALLLGGWSKLKKLSGYIDDKGYYIDYTINPYISSTIGTGNKTVKKIGLSPFEVTLKSSIEQVGYYILPTELSKIISGKDKKYSKINISNFKIDNLNVAYSYRYKSNPTYRTQMIDQVISELDKLNKYNLSTEKPNAYLLKYLTNYYDAYYESNKFIYETDSIPFMSILLSGYVNQFIPNINYISNYELAVLRMIEYNIYPSFIITKEEAYKLRYTNYEYLNSTQYDLWKDLMVQMYNETNEALKYVINENMIGHEYLQNGVAKCSYSNNVIIYINYNKDEVNCDGISIAPYTYVVKGGN